jgi:hypothetical protein
MGDMLVKNGEVEPARKVYAIAKLSKGYESWSYKSLLEERIAQAEERARQFQALDPQHHPEIMFQSAYSCTACHAK